ncbi:TPA: hypothetical protein KV183_003377 [Morganella morganii]|nr:hypothetical protein [Morganella morganii]
MAVNENENKSDNTINNSMLWSWVQAICTVLFVFFALLKLYNSTIQIDLPNLLSIILAIFSIGLSAAFYFKATDTSNRFYQNTYVHSKDIATLLAKIESGFGEKLNSIDSNYIYVRETMQSLTNKKEIINDEMAKKNEEMEEIETSKDRIIDDLISKADLAEKEKENIKKQLQSKHNSLKLAQESISELKSELNKLNNHNTALKNIKNGGFDIYFRNVLLPMLLKNKDGSSNDPSNPKVFERRFKELLNNNELGMAFRIEASNRGLFTLDGDLMPSGWDYIKSII